MLYNESKRIAEGSSLAAAHAASWYHREVLMSQKDQKRMGMPVVQHLSACSGCRTIRGSSSRVALVICLPA